ncbi:hypothetical protein D3C77_274320 [compost metagenome]
MGASTSQKTFRALIDLMNPLFELRLYWLPIQRIQHFSNRDDFMGIDLQISLLSSLSQNPEHRWRSDY